MYKLDPTEELDLQGMTDQCGFGLEDAQHMDNGTSPYDKPFEIPYNNALLEELGASFSGTDECCLGRRSCMRNILTEEDLRAEEKLQILMDNSDAYKVLYMCFREKSD